MDIDGIRRAFMEGRFELSRHAVEELDNDGLERSDLQSAGYRLETVKTECDSQGVKCLVQAEFHVSLLRLALSWLDETTVYVITVYTRPKKRGRNRK